MNGTLTDIAGIKVGHAHDLSDGITGCTVVLCPAGTVGGVDQRGGAPGTRETDLLRPLHLITQVHAIFLAGGSAFGLATGDGVMRYLEEQRIGYPVGELRVPIVPGAILFDLDLGNPAVRPDASMGYAACVAASNAPVEQGSVGAGAGAKVGALLGVEFATKGGIGSASLEIGAGVRVAALFTVNAAGDVTDEDGRILAGLRAGSTLDLLKNMVAMPNSSNTVIGVVATNARLTKEEVNKVAQMAQDGIARAVRPAHLPFDGDTIFALATGEVEANAGVVGAFAAEVTAQAIRNGVRLATARGGVPAMGDLG